MLDPRAILPDLARNRPIFHSEADLQHALAWQIHVHSPEARIRLETRPLADEVLYLDLPATDGDCRVAFELKYLTRALTTTIGDEQFSLRNHGAQDLGRYDIIKDLCRVERVVGEGAADLGYVLALTNDPSYWKQSARTDTVDAQFRLHDGRRLADTLSWSLRAGAGTTRGRETLLTVAGSYPVVWNDYSRVADRPGGAFRYLLLEVGSGSRDASPLAYP